MSAQAQDQALGQPVDNETAVSLAQPQQTVVDNSLTPEQLAAIIAPVEAFYGFWNNGSQALLDRAIGQDFNDPTLPPGRPQGPTGPAVASKGFREAVPDLRCDVVLRVVAGDRVATHMRFTGHFTGSFMGHTGSGQAIDFIATDIVRVRDGRITDNWHLEDNLTFMRQAGLLPGGEG